MGYDYRSVIVYADAKDNLFILPTGESKRLCGATMELDILKHLAFPFSDEEVEEALLESMDLCFSEDPDDAPGYRTVMEKYLNVKGYAKAVKDKKCIIFHWDSSFSPYRQAHLFYKRKPAFVYRQENIQGKFR